MGEPIMTPSWIDVCHFFIDELKIKPKEEKMQEKRILVRDEEIKWRYAAPNTSSLSITIKEALRLYEEAKRIMEEDKIKVGDFVLYCKAIHKVECAGLSSGIQKLSLIGEGVVPLSSVTKITNPAHIKALTEIFGAMK
jgi:hypothetical protein